MATANIKISQLPELGTMINTAVIPVVAYDETFKITGANLATFFGSNSQANTGNIGFSGNVMYNLNGMTIENGDLTHGATAELILPASGNTTAAVQINNAYGNVTITAGTNDSVLNIWQFGSNGNLTLPSNTSAINYANGQPYGGGSGGNAGLPLANGTSNFDIAVANGNATVTIAGDNTWTFTNDGNFRIPQGGGIGTAGMGWPGFYSDNGYLSIQGKSANPTYLGQVESEIFLSNNNNAGYVNISLYDLPGEQYKTWQFTPDGNLAVAGNIVVNDTQAFWAYSNIGLTVTANVNHDVNGFSTEEGGDTYLYANANVVIVSDSGNSELTWKFDRTGQTIPPLLNTARGDNPSGNVSGYTINIGDGQNEAIITTPDGVEGNPYAQRLVINPGKGQDGSSGEGGDIYLWAGRGGSGDGTSGGGTGGDIKIRGGQGMAQGAGGYIRIEAGDSNNDVGQAGYIEIRGGQTTGGTPGYVNIQGGYNGNGTGGDVTLISGYGNPAYGNVVINTTGGINLWKFDNTGNLTLPNVGDNIEAGITTVNGALQLRSNVGTEMDYYDSADENHFGYVSIEGTGTYIVQRSNVAGNVSTVEWQFTPDGNLTTPTGAGDITMSSGNITGVNTVVGDQANVDVIAGSYTWQFDTAGNLTLPSIGNIIGNTANNAGSMQWIGNSSGDGYGYTTLQLRPDNTLIGNDQYIIVDPTSPSHIHIRAGGTQDNSYSYLFLGGENSHFQVAAGSNPPVYVAANSHVWTYDTTGNLNLPGNASVTTTDATAGLGGNSVTVQAGASDPVTWNSNPGGNLNLKGGYGSFADGGGGAGGNVNIFAGASADTVSGNVNIYTGNSGEHAWLFDNTGALTAPGNISAGNFIGGGSNVDVVAGAYSWTFDNTGNLTMPGGTVVLQTLANNMTLSGDTAQITSLVFAGNIAEIYAGANVNIYSNQQDPGNIRQWSYRADGTMTFPGSTIKSPNGYEINIITTESGNMAYAEFNPNAPYASMAAFNVVENKNIFVETRWMPGNSSYTAIGVAGPTWYFAESGNLTLPGNTFAVNYANGTPVSLGGNYGNANVVANLAALGSNPVSTTGNVTGGNIISSGNINALSAYVNAAAVITSGRIDVGTAMSAVGNVTGGNILTTGLISSTGNINTAAQINSAGNVNLTSNTANIVFSTGAYITGNATGREGSILLQPYTGAGSTFPGVKIGGAGRIIAPNDSVSIVLNSTDVTFQLPIQGAAYAASSTTTGSFRTTGGIGIGGNIYVAGNTATGNNAIVAGVTNTLLANSTASFSANVNSYSQITFQNKSTGADATADFILTADNGSDTVNYSDFGIINSGYDNLTPTNSLGNIVYAADTYLYAQGNVSNTSQSGGNLAIGTTVAGKSVKIFAGGNTASALVANISNTGISVAGNVTASNFVGNISITGNVTGTSANVTLVAGSYSYTFNNIGELNLPTVGGDEGGQVNLGIPATNTSLQNKVTVDVYQNKIRFFEGSANAQGVYIDLSQSPSAVGGQIGYKASGYVNAGSFVTLDNIKVTLTSSGNRGLSLATTTGSITATLAGTYATQGGGGASSSNGTITVNTTPSTSHFSWNFAGQGDLSTYVLNDTTNSRTYRITLVIGGGYLNNFISIERL